MKLAGRFLVAELVWATGILALMVGITLLNREPLAAEPILQWVARALGLAAFPAGIAIAPDVLDDVRPWRQPLHAMAIAGSVSVVIFVLMGLLPPLVSDQSRTLVELHAQISDAERSWESRNAAAWAFYTAFFAPLNALLFAAIGVQVGIWSRRSVPVSLHRALYWAVGLGLLISGYTIWDSTYETVVLHTAADASFAAFYTVLVPASICAGLALPTLALLRRADLPGRN